MSLKPLLIQVLAIGVLGLTAGCSSNPTVRYVAAGGISPEDRGAPQFTLSGSRVSLGLNAPVFGETKERARIAETPVPKAVNDVTELITARPTLTVTPAETADVYYIVPDQSIFKHVDLTVSYFDNTRLIKSIGAPVTDNTVKVISSIGGVLATVAPLMLSFVAEDPTRPAAPDKTPPSLSLPTVLDFSEPRTLEAALSSTGASIPGTRWKYRLIAHGTDGTAVPSKDFFAQKGSTGNYPFSACLSGTLQITDDADHAFAEKQRVASFPITIADPRYVRTVALPAKGTLTAHTVCGVDVKSANADVSGPLDVLEALAKQADAIYQAAKKK
jgi:hypothetical protein